MWRPKRCRCSRSPALKGLMSACAISSFSVPLAAEAMKTAAVERLAAPRVRTTSLTLSSSHPLGTTSAMTGFSWLSSVVYRRLSAISRVVRVVSRRGSCSSISSPRVPWRCLGMRESASCSACRASIRDWSRPLITENGRAVDGGFASCWMCSATSGFLLASSIACTTGTFSNSSSSPTGHSSISFAMAGGTGRTRLTHAVRPTLRTSTWFSLINSRASGHALAVRKMRSSTRLAR
mmetsp:Transcript_132937/g.230527  ORF Transcript_132937/g.230527 Transcript_132937/m.230527 type:complete len:236 (+) Transcript_132937:302-1009(+)